MSYLSGLFERQREAGLTRRPATQVPRSAIGVGRLGGEELIPSGGRELGGRRLLGAGDQREWYDYPDVRFTTLGRVPDQEYVAHLGPLARTALPTIPAWAAGEFSDPRLFYEWYSGMPPEQQRWVKGALSATNVARQEDYAANQRAIDVLRDAIAQLEGGRERFLSDPRWESLLSTIQGYATGATPAISPEELTAARLGLAQRYAREEAGAQASAAQRGVGASGNIQQTLDPMRVYTDVGGLQLAAQARAENRRAQLAATADLGRLLGGREQVSLAYQTELDRLASGIAAIEAGEDYEPTDIMAFDELAFAMNYFNDLVERSERLDAQYQEAADFSLWDLAQMALQFGGNFPGFAAGLFGA